MSADNAALAFTPLELLQAYISERLDRFVDHLISTGSQRIAVLGSREHATWMVEQIHGFRYIPITAFIDRPDRPDEFADMSVPSGSLDDNIVPLHADAVLIVDDKCEQTLYKLALDRLPIGTTVYRIYHRFPIGTAPLSASASVIEAKPSAPQTSAPLMHEIKPSTADQLATKL